MKKCFFILLPIILFLIPFTVFAHPGSLDENGGHYDKSTGRYHYHHGFPAHEHQNGECPYDFVDNRNTETNNSTVINNEIDKDYTNADYNVFFYIVSLVFWISLSFLLVSLFDIFDNCYFFIKIAILLNFFIPSIMAGIICSKLIIKEVSEVIVAIVCIIVLNLSFKISSIFSSTNKAILSFLWLTIFSFIFLCFIEPY